MIAQLLNLIGTARSAVAICNNVQLVNPSFIAHCITGAAIGAGCAVLAPIAGPVGLVLLARDGMRHMQQLVHEHSLPPLQVTATLEMAR